LDERQGWLGDHADASIESDAPAIAAYADYSANQLAASWLPSRDFATLWRGFVTKNPLTLSAPMSGAQLDATQALQLTVSGLASGERASFLDGATPLLEDAAANDGQASGRWSPLWGGVRGIVALAQSAAVTRTSRPAAVVLYGKAAPAPPVRVSDAGMPAADGGHDAAKPSDFDASAAHDTGALDAGGAPADGDPAKPAADGGETRGAETGAGDDDSAESQAQLDGAIAPRASAPLQGGCSCELRPGRPVHALQLLTLLLPFALRRRRV
jgi:hypothetical protein